MSASPLSILRAGPPPPKVVLLPDALFFTRAVPITAGATPADAAAQVELALESMSPFPVSQLYHGWYWTPGSDHAFAYAAYRRRFTSEQTAEWSEAELVIPASAALFGGKYEPATAVLLHSAEGITAIYWESSAVPGSVTFRPVAPEATDDERAKARDDVLRALGGSRNVVDLYTPPIAEATLTDQEIVFRAGELESRLPSVVAAPLDVRDKDELAAMRAGKRRDLALWRVALGCVAALLLLAIGEFALVGGRGWQKVRIGTLEKRRPDVQKIEQAQGMATSIQDLVTKRFLPVEMVTAVLGENAERKPSDIAITNIQNEPATATRGSAVVMLLQTTNAGQAMAFRDQLLKSPDFESVNLESLPSTAALAKFRLTVVFKQGVLKPEST